MLIHVKTFNGVDLQSGYKTYLLNQRGTTTAEPVFIPQVDADAVDAGVFTVQPRTLALSVEIADYANRDALISALKGIFKRGTRADLVALFADDGVDYQINCRVVNLAQDPEYPMYYHAILQTGATAWRSVSAETDTWSPSGTGGTKSVTVGGDTETRLIAELSATAAPSSGFFHQNLYRFVNVPGVNFGMRAWCITLNTAALVTASKMRADCFDLRLYNGETEIKRWIDGPNTTTTKVWFNAEMRAGATLKLKTAINNSQTVTALAFVVNKTTKNTIKAMANEGIIYHGSEWFAYKGRSDKTCTLTIIRRGLWGTTKQAHAANDTFAYIQNPIRMVYGNPAATDPALDDDEYDNEKPMFNLNTSDNTQWVYDATTKFVDEANPNRTGQWKRKVSRVGTVSKTYDVKQDAESGDPALGLKAGAYLAGSTWKADTVELSYELFCAAGFNRVTTTGRKFRNTAKWVAFNGFQRSADGNTWVNLWVEATPGSVNSWGNWATHSNVSVDNTAKYLRHAMVGNFPVLANAYGMSEALTVTAEFVAAKLPSGAFLGETSNYPLSLIFSNDENDDAVELNYPALYNLPFLMNGETFTATFDEANAHRSLALNDEGRSAWIRLKPGSNTLRITAVDIGTQAINLSWYRRRL